MNYKDLITADIGRLPPQAIDMEESVLGALMLESDAIEKIINVLHEDMFYKENHSIIYSTCKNIYNSKSKIDILTVAENLRSNNKLDHIGGPVYISQLTMKVASASHIEEHTAIIVQKHIQRELIKICSVNMELAYDNSIDVNECIINLENSINNLNNSINVDSYTKIKELINEEINNITYKQQSGHKIEGINTGFGLLNSLTNGWQPTDLIILAARPSMGKTAFAIYESIISGKYNNPTVLFSLEMSKSQLVNRIISSETGCNPNEVRNGQVELQRITNDCDKIYNSPIFIDDSPMLNTSILRTKLKRMIKKHGIKFCIIDYLQLMQPTDKRRGREEQVSDISRNLKLISKELNIPILCLSQLNRDCEKRKNGKPMLSDLRESGAIEQDADIVLFLWRPELYDCSEYAGKDTKDMVVLMCEKHRHGSLFDFIMKKNEYCTVFNSYEDTPKEKTKPEYYNPEFYTGINPNKTFETDRDPF